MKRLVILGAGTGGTALAHILRRRLSPAAWAITVVDRSPDHYYQPGFLFVPFGLYAPRRLVRERAGLLPGDVELVIAPIEGIDPAANEVRIGGGEALPYDILVIATGCDIAPGETPGLLDDWRVTAFDFYTPGGSAALARRLESFQGGTLAVHVNEMPIKCPVAPLEFAFLADWHFLRRGLREAVDIVFVTPLSGPFTKPAASAALGALLGERGIRVVPDFAAERVDAAARKLVGYDGREVAYDLLVSVPTNMGDQVVGDSGLGDELRFVPTDPKTLRSKSHENIFVIGDAANVPASKAGSVVHFQARTVAGNVERAAAGRPLAAEFDGHANCFIETGRGRAILIDFNYEVEPLPGRFPFPLVGPLPLLKPSRLNHWAKLAFRPIYWRLMLRGRPLPFISDRMAMAGKKRPPAAGATA
ncbi:MAG TPA: FAD/NAD(P)-binding oxidoreductase [Candidatus Aminicenantes bacterium]|nr:FAD/NAD(P)-binding oxidoreductase [Candidatus Aminicenantes bacterium]HRY64856.1 FAD/NAD(P)-binding oxidoreductase [Candidatus Aminicenantes bacterium]HRZ71769.1 FAD/NAD(P)-binding oxidoreductase [Candidatus Aminicenantes bacterium]